MNHSARELPEKPQELHEGMKDYSRKCRCGEFFTIHPTGRCKQCILAGLSKKRG